MERFSVIVVSPNEMLYEGDAEEIVVPGQEGGMSILGRHAPLLAVLKKGTIEIINDSSQKEIDIESGFVEVSKKKASTFVNIFVRQA